MSAKAGWYPDPGGGVGLYRFWDGKAWSAATSPNPAAPPPAHARGAAASPPAAPLGGSPYGSQPAGSQSLGTQPYGSMSGSLGAGGQQPLGYGQPGGAYASYQQTKKKKTPVGWWIGAAALLVVIVVVVVLAVRAIGGGGIVAAPGGGQPSEDVCPTEQAGSGSPLTHPNDGRVHGGPVSYPELGAPWQLPETDTRVPFGIDVESQVVPVESNYDGKGDSWVASILVGELQAGDGFYTPQQGAAIVVKCILGKFYGDNPVTSAVKVNQAATIDGHDGWLVESQLSFNIAGLNTKGELLIVAIVSTGATAGLYYASIPDTRPELIQPARDALKQLKVDG